MKFETTANRLWRRLTPADRLLAARAFFADPPQDLLGTALGVIVKARHMRPQVARSLSAEEQAKIVGTTLDVGEPFGQALLVSLHLSDRRPLLSRFLDALGLPHENGLLKEDADLKGIDEARLRDAATGLIASAPKDQVEVYFNTLWLQDPEQWAALQNV